MTTYIKNKINFGLLLAVLVLFTIGLKAENPELICTVTIEADEPVIAAGALKTNPHQTLVTVTVTPKPDNPIFVQVWLSSGGGKGTGSETHTLGSLNLYGPAEIMDHKTGAINKATAPGSYTTSPPLDVEVDTSGKAYLTLTSSNKLEYCVMNVKKKAIIDNDTVNFEWGEQALDMPELTVYGETFLVSTTRTFNGAPLKDHDTIFYISSVTVNGSVIAFDEANPTALDQYVKIISSDIRKNTSSGGYADSTVEVQADQDLEDLTVETRDFSVFVQ